MTSLSPAVEAALAKATARMPVRRWTVPRRIGIAGKMEHGKDTVAGLLRHKFGYVPVAFAEHLRAVCHRLLGVPLPYLTDKALKPLPVVSIAEDYALPFDPRNLVSVAEHLDNVLAYAYFTNVHTFKHANHRSDMTIRIGQNDLDPETVRYNFRALFNKHLLVPLLNGGIFSGREIMQLVGTEIFRAVDHAIWTWAWTRRVHDHALVACPDMRFPNEFSEISMNGGWCIQVLRPNYRSDTRTGTMHVSETALDGHQFHAVLVNAAAIGDLCRDLERSLIEYAKINTKAIDMGYAKLVMA